MRDTGNMGEMGEMGDIINQLCQRHGPGHLRGYAHTYADQLSYYCGQKRDAPAHAFQLEHRSGRWQAAVIAVPT